MAQVGASYGWIAVKAVAQIREEAVTARANARSELKRLGQSLNAQLWPEGGRTCYIIYLGLLNDVRKPGSCYCVLPVVPIVPNHPSAAGPRYYHCLCS